MGEVLSEIGDLVFSLVIGYIGAVELLYVVRHLYHWSFRHAASNENDVNNLTNLQTSLRNQLSEAEEKEALAGTKVMQDGVMYQDGFRIDPQQDEIDKLKDQQREKEEKEKRRKEIEIELAKHKETEIETRRQLEEAEAQLAKQRKQIEEDELKRKQAEKAEEEENLRKLLETERLREEKQRQLEEQAEAEENVHKLLEIERRREEEQQKQELAEAEAAEAAENQRKLIEAEIAAEERQRKEEEEEEEDENNRMEQRQTTEAELEAIKLSKKLLSAERDKLLSTEPLTSESAAERKQKLIEENARKFLEAELEMVELQQQMMETPHQRKFITEAQAMPVIEEPCVRKRIIAPSNESEAVIERPILTVKTQLGQTKLDSYTTKPLQFPGVSDDGSSVYPSSSTQQSVETSPTSPDELTTTIGLQIAQQERQEPDGEDNIPTIQYTDEYLRSLDGIKNKPLVREDGTGRRRAFKKRRSSGSSTSSRDSRTSREEELKMFTSLEEEEMRNVRRDEHDFSPISYTGDSTLKVKAHNRRHKRSPAKDAKPSDDNNLRSSLEMLGEENTNPWGELVPEHYKNTEFWKREKAISIDEEKQEIEKPAPQEDAPTNFPRKSSFEAATQKQNEKALAALQNQFIDNTEEEVGQIEAKEEESTESDNQKNLQTQTSQITEDNASPSRSSTSPCLRRSPRIDEMAQYEERWKETTEQSNSTNQTSISTPTISIESASDNAPWRDEYGLIMQGLSDFYDFQASVNPSRSRSTSRNPSPANSKPATPTPKNVSYIRETRNFTDCLDSNDTTIEVYDDTGNLIECEFQRTNILNFVDSLADENDVYLSEEVNSADDQMSDKSLIFNSENFPVELRNVADDMTSLEATKLEAVPTIFVNTAEENQSNSSKDDLVEMNELICSLRANRSRSRSPLPSTKNIELSLEARRNKRIQRNDEIFDKMIETNNDAGNEINESHTISIESLRMERVRSKSRSRSPLPTTDNLQLSLDARRKKLIKHNDEIFEKLMNLDINEEFKENESNYLRDSLSPTKKSREERSRSRSPLPTSDNIQRSIDTRRNRLIQHNDELFEKLSTTTTTKMDIENELHTDLVMAASPSIRIENTEQQTVLPIDNVDDDNSQEHMSELVASLLVRRSRSRSKSPMRIPTDANLAQSLEARTNKLIERNDEIFERLKESIGNSVPKSVTIQYIFETEKSTNEQENIDKLTIEPGRSRSRTPSRSLSNSPNRKHFSSNEADSVEQYEFIETSHSEPNFQDIDSPLMHPMENLGDCYDFHLMLNLEASHNRTLSKNTEELESTLAEKQRLVDEDALNKLKTASEETELRTLTPTDLIDYTEEISNSNEASDIEELDGLGELTQSQRLQQLRCSPTTPDYDRTISEEWKDVQKIKANMLTSGFKRSTYVGESMDLGYEYENLRHEAADFRRSRSLSPTSMESEMEAARNDTVEKHKIQDQILAELISADKTQTDENEVLIGGAKPKSDRKSSSKEFDWSISNEVKDTQRIKENMLGSGFKRSTFVGESVDFSDARRDTATFRRSLSKSRSPLDEQENDEIEKIDSEAAKRELQDRVLDEIEKTTLNFQDFSRHLNVNFLENERRASDSALIQKPELLIQFEDQNSNFEMEPEEYHHFRRFSLYQEQPVEEYPNDDSVYVSQIEIRSLNGIRTWIQKDYYSEDLQDADIDLSGNQQSEEVSDENDESIEEQLREELDESDGSEDERQTVVDVDDEIDTDICDFNERGPADESHHEQSECEEAEREMDQYADRDVNDWSEEANDNEYLEYGLDEVNYAQEHELEEEGAVGGLTSINETSCDSDSYTIDQIYDEAIKNRKQSGILRDYDCIIEDMQTHFLVTNATDAGMTTNSDSEHYALWAKTRDLERLNLSRSNGVDASLKFLENERNDNEIRYLGDADMTARQSTRLRSRYGYVPLLQNKTVEEVDIDVNYKPKREYNWRKNFKIDETEQNEYNDEEIPNENEEAPAQYIDIRKLSLGGESITLFSRSPEKDNLEQIQEEPTDQVEIAKADNDEKKHDKITEKREKPKKKKSKKKLRKDSNVNAENINKDDDDSESQIYSRRSSSFQMDTDSPKRKSRSRRSSKSSVTTEESSALFSPRSSVGIAEPIFDILEENMPTTAPIKKKIKKRKQIKEPQIFEDTQRNEPPLCEEAMLPISTIISPLSGSNNLLATLSPQNSVCVTPASIESDEGELTKVSKASTNTTTTTTTIATIATTTTRTASAPTPVDTFDILKDANFYPLF